MGALPDTILLVDDNPFILQVMADLVREMGLEPVCAADGADATDRLLHGSFRIVVTDLEMPVRNGLGVIARIRQRRDGTKVVALSDPSQGFVGEARGLGIDALLVKPFAMADLKRSIERLLCPVAAPNSPKVS